MMSILLDGLSWVFLTTGAAFYVIGAYGLIKMPDVFTRMHAASVSDTFGAALILIGMMFQTTDPLVLVRLVIILVLLLYTGPVATHALAQASLTAGLKPILAEPASGGQITSEQVVPDQASTGTPAPVKSEDPS